MRGRRIEAKPPLFPGYVFVVIESQWHAARWSPGVSNLIMDGEKPTAPAKASFICGTKLTNHFFQKLQIALADRRHFCLAIQIEGGKSDTFWLFFIAIAIFVVFLILAFVAGELVFSATAPTISISTPPTETSPPQLNDNFQNCPTTTGRWPDRIERKTQGPRQIQSNQSVS